MAAAAARLLAVALSAAILVVAVGGRGVVPVSSGAERPSVERELDAARAAIRRAARRHGNNASSAPGTWFRGDDVDYALLARVYRNPAAFHR